MTKTDLLVTIGNAARDYAEAMGVRPTIVLLGRDHIDTLFDQTGWHDMTVHGMRVLQHTQSRDAVAVTHDVQAPHEAA
jgi:hypothetical protein